MQSITGKRGLRSSTQRKIPCVLSHLWELKCWPAENWIETVHKTVGGRRGRSWIETVHKTVGGQRNERQQNSCGVSLQCSITQHDSYSQHLKITRGQEPEGSQHTEMIFFFKEIFIFRSAKENKTYQKQNKTFGLKTKKKKSPPKQLIQIIFWSPNRQQQVPWWQDSPPTVHAPRRFTMFMWLPR